MGRYRVWFYREIDKSSPVEDSFNKLNSAQEAKVGRQILHLSEFGISIHNKSLRKLTGTPLWEVRILGKDNIRLFCADTKRGIVVLHLFIKKTQKTSSSDISLAMKRLDRVT
jgi:phage-related protein